MTLADRLASVIQAIGADIKALTAAVNAGGGGTVSGYQPALVRAVAGLPCLVKTGASSLSVKAGTQVTVGSTVVSFAVQTAVSMPALSSGEDYSVWVQPDGAAVAVADPYSAPAAPPAAGAVKIGGFHYGLVAPGTTVAGGSFATSGTGMAWSQADVDRIAGINEHSIWDLGFRPSSDPRGMTCVKDSSGFGLFWVDIYFCSQEHISNGTSRYNTNVASGTVLPRIPVVFGGNGSAVYGRMSWFEANEIAFSHSKRLLSYQEFAAAAYGVTEGQSIGGASSTIPSTARQAGYTSKWGGEQMTGHQWTFGDNAHAVSGAAWISGANRGQTYGTPVAAFFGGTRSGSWNSGSRCSSWGSSAWSSDWFTSLRCAADHYQGEF